MHLTPDMMQRLELLEQKFAAMGQDMVSYLDGLLYADYLTYWDYIHLDTLLSLQSPRTSFPDERIFIIYHQITELYLKLTLDAIEQLLAEPSPRLSFVKRQLGRVVSYFKVLADSFDAMVGGLDKEEFLKFRMSLLPSSGFQSGQYRKVEILSTSLHLLVVPAQRGDFDASTPVVEVYPHLYWKQGATELASGKKTLTLRQFEKKYAKAFLELAEQAHSHNVRSLFLGLPPDAQNDPELRQLLRQYDYYININWRLQHYRVSVRYLNREPKDISATGGTNWQQYLPPKNQRIIFFPEVWTEAELDEWGRHSLMGEHLG